MKNNIIFYIILFIIIKLWLNNGLLEEAIYEKKILSTYEIINTYFIYFLSDKTNITNLLEYLDEEKGLCYSPRYNNFILKQKFIIIYNVLKNMLIFSTVNVDRVLELTIFSKSIIIPISIQEPRLIGIHFDTEIYRYILESSIKIEKLERIYMKKEAELLKQVLLDYLKKIYIEKQIDTRLFEIFRLHLENEPNNKTKNLILSLLIKAKSYE